MMEMTWTTPKMTVNNYENVWRQVLAYAKHNNWGDERILTFVPTILDDFLFDAFETLSTKQCSTVLLLKKNLGEVSGAFSNTKQSPAQLFMSRNQNGEESVQPYAIELKKLFLKAFPTEKMTSNVLLERFVSGLHNDAQKFLIKMGTPEDLETAIVDASRIFNENRGTSTEYISNHHKMNSDVCSMLEKLTDRIAALEIEAQNKKKDDSAHVEERRCFRCKRKGHIQSRCPLNFQRSPRYAGRGRPFQH